MSVKYVKTARIHFPVPRFQRVPGDKFEGVANLRVQCF
eukprot:CAMPEP_0171483594 /NCGR_PEP_ID=MMETSP0946-20130122/8281_1 /TAXON_ID=109269 /ORGANISM="Vaucheria litorea, Strain CCMP2940" /LENGTH=37 /DNA_ID= /DNA_START= /DNA_END= /DNA_ORIENTATION=